MNHGDSYFACEVPDCGYRKACTNPDDLRRFLIDRGHMIDHYKWNHAALFGVKRSIPGVAHSDWWNYGPIPNDIGPSFYDAGTGVTVPWKDVRK